MWLADPKTGRALSGELAEVWRRASCTGAVGGVGGDAVPWAFVLGLAAGLGLGLGDEALVSGSSHLYLLRPACVPDDKSAFEYAPLGQAVSRAGASVGLLKRAVASYWRSSEADVVLGDEDFGPELDMWLLRWDGGGWVDDDQAAHHRVPASASASEGHGDIAMFDVSTAPLPARGRATQAIQEWAALNGHRLR